MGVKGTIRTLLSSFGLNVTRQSENPAYHLLGLGRIGIMAILDVGANTGQFARRIRRTFPTTELLCFEPLPGPYGSLAAWASTTANVRVFNFALGERNLTSEMYAHVDHSPSSSLLKTTPLSVELYPKTQRQAATQVQVRKLDDVIAEMIEPPGVPRLLKMDVQGYEVGVLRGAALVLKTVSACIVEITLDRLYEQQSTFRDVFQELDSAGFHYAGNLSQVYGSDGHVIYLDAVFRK